MAWPFAAAAALMTTVWGWFLVTPNFYSWEAALFALIALACYLRGAERPARALDGLAGVATGMTVLVKQNVGAYTAAALLLTIWLSRAFDTHTMFAAASAAARNSSAGLCVPIVPALLCAGRRRRRPILVRELDLLPADQVSAAVRAAVPLVLSGAARSSDLARLIPACRRRSRTGVYEIWIKLVDLSSRWSSTRSRWPHSVVLAVRFIAAATPRPRAKATRCWR